MQDIYLDHQASTPTDPHVLEEMLPWFRESFANASSEHRAGQQAAQAVEKARQQVASLINCEARAVIFTSGATESINLAHKGLHALFSSPIHIISCKTEHRAVLDCCQELAEKNCQITWLDVDSKGHINTEELEAAIRPETKLVSIMQANNEIGTIHDISAIGRICREHGLFFHCDAAQSFGKVPIDVEAMNIDLLSISGHKIYGPKGIGALYVRRRRPRVRLEPILSGGGHERGLRSGSLNVPGIVGLGAAAERAGQHMQQDNAHVKKLRDRLEDILFDRLDGLHLNGDSKNRLANCLNISIEGIEGIDLMTSLPNIAFSLGAACSSAIAKPSHVLRALGRSPELSQAGIRLSPGKDNTMDEIITAADAIIDAVEKLRSGEKPAADACYVKRLEI